MSSCLCGQVAPTPEDLDWLEDNGLLLHLESLRMPGASLSQQGEDFVRTLLQCSGTRLTSLDLRQVTASSADFLEGLPQHNALHTLNASGGLWGAHLPSMCISLVRMLQHHMLADQSLPTSGSQHPAARLAGWFGLHLVSMRPCSVGCRGLDDLHLLRGMTNLRDLDLSQTDISDSGLFRIAAMSQLTRLSLRDTAVTAVAFKALANLGSLQSLDLSHTSIHSRIHQSLGLPGSPSATDASTGQSTQPRLALFAAAVDPFGITAAVT